MSRTLKLAENRHCGSGMIWIQVKETCDLKMIGKLPCLIFDDFWPISANSHQRDVAYGVLRFSQLPGFDPVFGDLRDGGFCALFNTEHLCA